MSHASSSRAASCAIAVMAKQSIPGRAKTRLIPLLGADGAALLNTAFLRDIAANLASAGETTPIDPWMAYAPAGAEDFFRRLFPNGVGLVETVAPDFGLCLGHAISALLAAGHVSACVLNSDSPTLPSSYLAEAARVLSAPGDRIVIGPAVDGGYYLIGMKQRHSRLFEDIDWSTERVFDQTIQRARELSLDVVALPNWYDVDDAASLRLLVGELFEDRPFRAAASGVPACRHTRAVLRPMLELPTVAQAVRGTHAKPDAA